MAHLLAAVESFTFFPSNEAKCCSRASRRLLGAWGNAQTFTQGYSADCTNKKTVNSLLAIRINQCRRVQKRVRKVLTHTVNWRWTEGGKIKGNTEYKGGLGQTYNAWVQICFYLRLWWHLHRIIICHFHVSMFTICHYELDGACQWCMNNHENILSRICSSLCWLTRFL